MSDTNTDIATLREVQRFLASNEFVGIEELAARSGVARLSDLTDDLAGGRKVVELPADTTVSVSPLPKRRSA